MPRQHLVTMLALAALSGSCGDPTRGPEIWSTLGSAPVPASGASAARSICEKLAACGAFRVDDAKTRDASAASPVAYVVAAIEQAQQSSALDACAEDLQEIIDKVEGAGVSVPWDGVAACLAGADCALLKSEQGALSVANQCAAQLGISISVGGQGSPQPQPPPARDWGVPVRRDAGVVLDPDLGRRDAGPTYRDAGYSYPDYSTPDYW